jgi:hypothetical protein
MSTGSRKHPSRLHPQPAPYDHGGLAITLVVLMVAAVVGLLVGLALGVIWS